MSDASAYIGFAQLSEDQLGELRQLEQELGAVVIALQPTVPVAALSDAQVARLQEIERRMGLVLLAVKG